MGCPHEIQTDPNPDVYDGVHSDTEAVYAAGFAELFPGTSVPKEVGIPCGAQFALSKNKVLERPVEDYGRYRQWLWDTPLDDLISGRVLEYSWHSTYCPRIWRNRC